MILPTTLSIAAAAALINMWLGMRIGRLRHQTHISVGDGGNELMIRRMRAQANFHENTPIALILIGLIEAAGKGGVWLAPVAALFMLGRVMHGVGMDGGKFEQAGRGLGILSSMLVILGLAVVAVLISLGKF